MTFTELPLKGCYIVDPDVYRDVRGAFVRCWSFREFEARGLVAGCVEINLAVNELPGTLRGMHYQAPPHEQTLLVRCVAGAVYDVVVDLRPHSKTFMQWVAVELTAENRQMLYIPPGFAHGYQTLRPHTEVLYQMSSPYAASSGRGVRWNDPAFGIDWPEAPRIMLDRDLQFPDFADSRHSQVL